MCERADHPQGVTLTARVPALDGVPDEPRRGEAGADPDRRIAALDDGEEDDREHQGGGAAARERAQARLERAQRDAQRGPPMARSASDGDPKSSVVLRPW